MGPLLASFLMNGSNGRERVTARRKRYLVGQGTGGAAGPANVKVIMSLRCYRRKAAGLQADRG